MARHKMNINNCTPIAEGTQPSFISAENKCEHRGINVNHHYGRHFKIDGGVFPRSCSEEKCDYLLLNDTDKRAYFIELKGSDLEKAIEQVENTIRLLREGIVGYTIFRRIIYRSGTHDIQGSAALKWRKQHPTAIIKSRVLEENIS